MYREVSKFRWGDVGEAVVMMDGLCTVHGGMQKHQATLAVLGTEVL